MIQSQQISTEQDIENLVHWKLANLLVSNIESIDSNTVSQLKNMVCQLSQAATQGSSCLVLDNTQQQLIENHKGVMPGLVKVDSQTSTKSIDTALIVLQANRLYLNKYFHAENATERVFKVMAEQVKVVDESVVLEKIKPLKYIDAITSAVIINCLKNNLSIITGGPGTGKTTIVVRVLALLIDQFYHEHQALPKIEILAPTGKASARVKESIIREKSDWLDDLNGFALNVIQAIPETAQTVHKFLSINPNTGRTRFKQGQTANIDILIVDEASMLDVLLFEKLLTSLEPNTRLIFLGDPYQLESVEAGNVLAQIVAASQKPQNQWLAACCNQLTISHRFNDQSGIGQLAKAVNAGDVEGAFGVLESEAYNDVHWLNSDDKVIIEAIKGYQDYKDAVKTAKNLPQLHTETIKQLFSTFESWQVFSPFRSSLIGVNWLNQEIEKGLKLGEPETNYFGKPIIIKSNDHALQLNNGDIGICLSKDGSTVCFPAIDQAGQLSYRHIKTRILPEHELVFAMTVHKSQGSEYQSCMLFVPEPNENQKNLLKREIFYTALTRAKQQFYLMASEQEIETMVTTPTTRMSGLFETSSQ